MLPHCSRFPSHVDSNRKGYAARRVLRKSRTHQVIICQFSSNHGVLAENAFHAKVEKYDSRWHYPAVGQEFAFVALCRTWTEDPGVLPRPGRQAALTSGGLDGRAWPDVFVTGSHRPVSVPGGPPVD